LTIHSNYHHTCPNCDVEYLPYNDAVPCPNCGLVEPERFDIISRAVSSVQYNLEQNGTYIPLVWTVLSHGDQVLSLIFRLLEHDRNERDEQPFQDWARERLREIDSQGQQYYRDYIFEIAVRVHDELANAAGSEAQPPS
jgi:hypothetical protein